MSEVNRDVCNERVSTSYMGVRMLIITYRLEGLSLTPPRLALNLSRSGKSEVQEWRRRLLMSPPLSHNNAALARSLRSRCVSVRYCTIADRCFGNYECKLAEVTLQSNM